MPTYLYCLCAAGTAGPPPNGIDGGPVRTIEGAGLIAWVGDVPEPRVPPTTERVRAHAAVCDAALHGGHTPLPVRFGQTFDDDERLRAALQARAATLARRLAAVRGCVEMRVIVGQSVTEHAVAVRSGRAGRPDTGMAGGAGTAYLRRLAAEAGPTLAREAHCRRVHEALLTRAGPLLVADAGCAAERGLVYVAQLIRTTDVPRYRGVAAAVAARAATAVTLLGPFPPYSFAVDG